MASIPNFLTIFESKLSTLKKHIKAELEKPKKERKKAELKRLLHEAKKLQYSIRKVKLEHVKKCPHCGKDID